MTETAATAERFERIPLGLLTPSKTNPRQVREDHALKELADSIRQHGVIQPIIVRAKVKGPGYDIVAGERRFKASHLAGVPDIPAIVRAYEDDRAFDAQLIENIHREDFSPLEQAKAFRALIDSNPSVHTAHSIGARLGKSPQWVWDLMKLNDLVPEAKKILDAGRMEAGHAILIARLSPADQKRVIADDEDTGRPGGLWTSEQGSLLEEDDDLDAKRPAYEGLKAVTVRELARWIDTHVRFDVAQAAIANPLQFEPVKAAVDTAVAKPGRGKKFIAITFDYRVADDARDPTERTYGPQAWKRADGSAGTSEDARGRAADSPKCEHSVLGLVVAGPHRGESFDVCVARDKCEAHWKDEVAAKRKSANLRAAGKPTAAANTEQREAQRQSRAREAEQARDARWKTFLPALTKAVMAAANALESKLPAPVFAVLLKEESLPTQTTQANFARAVVHRSLHDQFKHAWYHDEPQLVAWATALGVDVKACEPAAAAKAKEATLPTSGAAKATTTKKATKSKPATKRKKQAAKK